MLIYNITIKIEWTKQPKWLQWMKSIYIAEIMKSNCFTKYQFARLLDIDEDDGPTYVLQLYTENREKYNEFTDRFLPPIEVLGYEKWGSSMLLFSTLMDVIV